MQPHKFTQPETVCQQDPVQVLESLAAESPLVEASYGVYKRNEIALNTALLTMVVNFMELLAHVREHVEGTEKRLLVWREGQAERVRKAEDLHRCAVEAGLLEE